MSRTTQPSEIREMAKEAARSFFLSGTPLNDSIIKIARERGLNPHQTARVVEVANSAVYQGLRKQAEQSGGSLNFEFDVARPEEIQERLSTDKLASAHAEADFARNLIEFEQPPSSGDELEKVASTKAPREVFRDPAVARRMNRRALTKAASVKERIGGDASMVALALEGQVSGLAKQAASLMRQGVPYSTLHGAAVAHAGPGRREDALTVMRKVAGILHKKNRIDEAELVKCAAMEAEDHFVSSALPVGTVVNGDSHFMKTFDTVVKTGRCASSLRQDFREINLGHRYSVRAVEG